MRRAALTWERAAARWAHVVLCVAEEERRLGERSGVAARYMVALNGSISSASPPATVMSGLQPAHGWACAPTAAGGLPRPPAPPEGPAPPARCLAGEPRPCARRRPRAGRRRPRSWRSRASGGAGRSLRRPDRGRGILVGRGRRRGSALALGGTVPLGARGARLVPQRRRHRGAGHARGSGRSRSHRACGRCRAPRQGGRPPAAGARPGGRRRPHGAQARGGSPRSSAPALAIAEAYDVVQVLVGRQRADGRRAAA